MSRRLIVVELAKVYFSEKCCQRCGRRAIRVAALAHAKKETKPSEIHECGASRNSTHVRAGADRRGHSSKGGISSNRGARSRFQQTVVPRKPWAYFREARHIS